MTFDPLTGTLDVDVEGATYDAATGTLHLDVRGAAGGVQWDVDTGGPPGMPTGLRVVEVERMRGGLDLRWDPVFDPTLVAYEWARRYAGQDEWSAPARFAAVEHHVVVVEPNVDTFVRVRAVNASGPGAWSDSAGPVRAYYTDETVFLDWGRIGAVVGRLRWTTRVTGWGRIGVDVGMSWREGVPSPPPPPLAGWGAIGVRLGRPPSWEARVIPMPMSAGWGTLGVAVTSERWSVREIPMPMSAGWGMIGVDADMEPWTARAIPDPMSSGWGSMGVSASRATWRK